MRNGKVTIVLDFRRSHFQCQHLLGSWHGTTSVYSTLVEYYKSLVQMCLHCFSWYESHSVWISCLYWLCMYECPNLT